MQLALGQDRKLGATTPAPPLTGLPHGPYLEAQRESYFPNIIFIKSAITVIISGGMKHFRPPGGHCTQPGAPGLTFQALVFTLPPPHLPHAVATARALGNKAEGGEDPGAHRWVKAGPHSTPCHCPISWQHSSPIILPTKKCQPDP